MACLSVEVFDECVVEARAQRDVPEFIGFENSINGIPSGEWQACVNSGKHMVQHDVGVGACRGACPLIQDLIDSWHSRA